MLRRHVRGSYARIMGVLRFAYGMPGQVYAYVSIGLDGWLPGR